MMIIFHYFLACITFRMMEVLSEVVCYHCNRAPREIINQFYVYRNISRFFDQILIYCYFVLLKAFTAMLFILFLFLALVALDY